MPTASIRKSYKSKRPASPINLLKAIKNSGKIKRDRRSRFHIPHSHASPSTSSDEYGSNRRSHLHRAVKVVPPSITRKSTDKKRGPRQLTARRIDRIRIFHAEVAKNPDGYGEIRGKQWISKLIACLDEHKKNAVISSDVQRWLAEYPQFFKDEIRHAEHANKRKSSGIPTSCTVSPASENQLSPRSSSLSIGLVTDSQEANNRLAHYKRKEVASKNGGKEGVKVQEEETTQITGAEQPNEDNKLVFSLVNAELPPGTLDDGITSSLYLPVAVVDNKFVIDSSMLAPSIFNPTADGKIIVSGEFTLESICANIKLLQQNGLRDPAPTINQFLLDDDRAPLPAITDGTSVSSSVSVNLNGLLTLESVRKGAEAMIKAVEYFRDASSSSNEGGVGVDWNSCFYALKFLEISLNK